MNGQEHLRPSESDIFRIPDTETSQTCKEGEDSRLAIASLFLGIIIFNLGWKPPLERQNDALLRPALAGLAVKRQQCDDLPPPRLCLEGEGLRDM